MYLFFLYSNIFTVFAKSIKISLSFFFSFIKEVGGFGSLVTKAWIFYKKEGFKGTAKKMRYILYQRRINVINEKSSYSTWYRKYNRISEKRRSGLQREIESFEFFPLFSIIIPTYNSNPKWLQEAIESVQNQIYPYWEICIADDASTRKETLELLESYLNKNTQIKVKFRKVNGHISASSNTALEMATGDFIALLDHDDILTDDALFWVADSINKNTQAALIYSDEDKIDEKGKLSDPYFKCDWNYHLFLSQNLVSHLGVYKTSLVRKIGGFRSDFDGSQDYDLALRFIEQIKDEQIIHIPLVLYHWRIHKQSTAVGTDVKPYAIQAGLKAISAHLNRKNILADVELLPTKSYRIKYNLPKRPPIVNVIIPTRNNPELLRKCVNSILEKTSYNNYRILIVDNNSTEKNALSLLNRLRQNQRVEVIRDERDFNFSAICNNAVNKVNGDCILFLNDDTEVISSVWLTELVSLVLQENVGIAGAKLLYPDKTLQHGGVILGVGGVAGHSHKGLPEKFPGYFGRAALVQEFSAVTAACMLIRTNLFKKVGGFDAVNLPVSFNDVDLCLKVRKLGFKIVWTPFAELYHYESITRGSDLEPDKVERANREANFMKKKWGDFLKNDPAYSPNLTLEAEDFGLAFPPRV